MRRIVRPFVKEFKSRSSAKAAGRAILTEEAGAAPEPFLQSFSAPPLDERPSPRPVPRDDNYEAAMKAADIVFGRKVEAEPAEAAAAAPPAAVGRVLPSLIEPFAGLREPDELRPLRRGPGRPRRIEPETQETPSPATEARAPARKGRPRRARPEASEPSPATAVARPIASAPLASPPLASPPLPLAAAAREDDAGAAPRRTRRSIQTRWVLKTALMAGERWKRRLPETAR